MANNVNLVLGVLQGEYRLNSSPKTNNCVGTMNMSFGARCEIIFDS